MMKWVLLALALLCGAARADAAILAACSEDVSCQFNGTVTVDTTAARFNSGYARFGMGAAGSTANVYPPTNRVSTNTFSSASSNFWMSYYYYMTTTSALNNVFTEVLDNGVVRIIIRAAGANIYKVSKRTAANSLTDLGATFTLCSTNTLCRIDIHVVYGTSGSIDVYNNGAAAFSYSGDVTTDSAITLNQADFSNWAASGSGVFSEIIVSDSDSRSMRMITCVPLAAGNTQTWTGAVSNINTNSFNDTVFNYTTSTSALSQWTTGCTVPSSGTTTVVDVRSAARLAKGASGPQNARFNLRISGADYNPGSNISGLTTSFQNFQYDWGANSPATGTPWVSSEFGSGFNLGVLSQP